MGTDPRFNSVHLDPSRRQDYRRAREALLGACGVATLYSGKSDNPSNTCIQPGDGSPPGVGAQAPPGLEHWLTEKDCVYPLHLGFNTVGRSGDNDVVVDDLYISRRHCTLLVHHDNTCELHDTASKNGTLLNGKKLSGPTRLRPGDEIRICNRTFVYRSRVQTPARGADTHTLAE